MMRRPDELDTLYRENFYYFLMRAFMELNPGEQFLDNWHLRAMAYKLQQCAEGKIRRLAIALPPRHLKSICANIAYSAWLLGRDPSAKIIAASYAQPLAEDHSRQFRELIQSEWYRNLFPGTQLSSGQNRALEQFTTEHGYRRATSVGGSLTGMGAGTIILDDLLKPMDASSEVMRTKTNDWFDNTVISRLNNPSEDKIITLMQRTHGDDLIGHIQEIGNWDTLSIPARATERTVYQIGDGVEDIYVREPGELIDPRRQDEENLDELRETMGERHFEAQFQQNPLPDQGNLLRREWLRESPETLDDIPVDQIVIAWDTATGEGRETDYSVATVWLVSGYDFHLIHVVRERFKYPELLKKAISLVGEFGAHMVLVEKASTGTPLVQELRRELDVRVRAMPPRGDKVARMDLQSVFIERGQVFLPKHASWLGEFLNEFLAFPGGSYDDQVDSTELFLRFMRWRNKLRPIGGRNGGGGSGGGGERRRGDASRRDMSRRNIKRRKGTPLPWNKQPEDDEEFTPTLVAGGV